MTVEIIKLPCKRQQYITDFYYAIQIDGLVFKVSESQYPTDNNGYPANEIMYYKLTDIKDALELGISYEHTLL
jgi:hypothetical protein